MKKRKLTFKSLILFLIILIVSIGLAMFFPSNIGNNYVVEGISFDESDSIIDQKVESISLQPETITKIFYKSELIGVIRDASLLDKALQEQQKKWSGLIDNDTRIKLDPNIYTLTEKSMWIYEDKDQQIIDYLINNDYFVIDAYRIDIVKNETIVDTIYVKSEADFSSALTKFALNFVDEDVFEQLKEGLTIESLTSYGEIDKNVYIEETIKSQQTGAAIDEVYMNADDIFDYLCYGKNYTLEYHTVEEYETVSGIASQNGLTAKQFMALNPSIKDANQTLIVGDKYNITYFNSMVNVIVEREVYSKKIVLPGNAQYRNDPTIEAGEIVQVVEASNGYNDLITTEVYANGVLSGYRIESEIVVVEPVSAEYLVGSGADAYVGDLLFGYPCENPAITCDYYCYPNHFGCDFINRYNRYGSVLAVTDGVILENGYRRDLGNYYRVDAGSDAEGNQFVLWYGHMLVPGYFEVGTEIVRGQIIGQIGSTGVSSGPHVHVAIYENGVRQDPCNYISCENVTRW